MGRALSLLEAALMGGGLLVLPSTSGWGAEEAGGRRRRSRTVWEGTTLIRARGACECRSERGGGHDPLFCQKLGKYHFGKERTETEGDHLGGRRH